MNFSVREISLIAITIALTFVLGWIFYFLANLFPLPGSKFVGVNVFTSFMIYFPIYKLNRPGAFLGTTAVFAGIMSLISLLMGLAILSAGLLTEIIGCLLLDEYRDTRGLLLTGFFGLTGTLSSLIITYLLTAGFGFTFSELVVPFTVFLLLSFLGGCLGARLAHKIINNYLEHLF